MGMSAIVIPKPKPKSKTTALKYITVEEVKGERVNSTMLIGREIGLRQENTGNWYFGNAVISRVTPFCCSTGQLGLLHAYKRSSEFGNDLGLNRLFPADKEFMEYMAKWLDKLTPLGTTDEHLMCWSVYLREATQNHSSLEAIVQKAGFKPTMSYDGRSGKVKHYNKANDFNKL
jgi:hypothetical protein